MSGGIEAVADRFFAAVSTGDVETLEAIYRDDVAVWHNYDDVSQSKAESIRLLGWLTRKVGPLNYVEVRRLVLADGFIQQHVVEVAAAAGDPIRMPAMLRVYCDAEQVSRIEEYVDPTPINSLIPAT
ncbi:ketosteroid isomerase-like protein [Jatrophihabitans sp. GAS493]|uniref:nuclear transport factor 2 family protein n=1 Tax=Jatrophihabitans sp. GAS493 TaxID=1907575 RepID=UPI000BB8F311|nr:nuclear transport factor 2 family protein [Jatrophihabitans sp. GAS493]SOD71805.1 ketosteroid isomerase-like protein [Jatrophihabitans sp. GAS493]